MSDKPILFSAPMVRALLAGTKTQTRRIINPQPVVNSAGLLRWDIPKLSVQTDAEGLAWHMLISKGDRLYVREHWCTGGQHDHLAPRDLPQEWAEPIEYIADGTDNRNGRFRQGMHMPRWASRLTLTVTDVRVQRLQEISIDDAAAEGVFVPEAQFAQQGKGAPVLAFAGLWESINGPGSWESNPWVAAYSFTVEHCNIDQARAA